MFPEIVNALKIIQIDSQNEAFLENYFNNNKNNNFDFM